MPARAIKGRGQGDPVAAFVALASDPKAFGEKLSELAERSQKAEEAERKVAKAAQELSKREVALVERTREQDEREKGLVEREGVIAIKEKSAAEQIAVADALVVQSRERESSVNTREKDLERRATEAITAVRALVKK